MIASLFRFHSSSETPSDFRAAAFSLASSRTGTAVSPALGGAAEPPERDRRQRIDRAGPERVIDSSTRISSSENGLTAARVSSHVCTSRTIVPPLVPR